MRWFSSLLLLLPLAAECQSITGQWKTIDDNTGEVKAIVEIFERQGKIYGKIVQIFPPPEEDPNPICDRCPEEDDRFNDRVIGMEIIRDMNKADDEYEGGTILDPEAGRVYRCRLWVENGDLKVRGYWGFFYRTQTWKKVL